MLAAARGGDLAGDDVDLVRGGGRDQQVAVMRAGAVQHVRVARMADDALDVQRVVGLLDEALGHLPGTIEHGDLAVREEGEGGRLLPTAIFARWSNPR